jgi:hypothetical protein
MSQVEMWHSPLSWTICLEADNNASLQYILGIRQVSELPEGRPIWPEGISTKVRPGLASLAA